jgi:hypothetical protein
MQFLGETATRIINEVKGVNRVVYRVTSKPLGDNFIASSATKSSISRLFTDLLKS